MTSRSFTQPSEIVVRYFIAAVFVFLLSLSNLSCSKPFEPEVQYAPKLNVYSVLFANANTLYVRVTPVVQSPSDVGQAVHGASVILSGADPNDRSVPVVSLTDTTTLVNGVLSSFYYAPVKIAPGRTVYHYCTRMDIPTHREVACRPLRVCDHPRPECLLDPSEPERCCE